MSKKKQPTLEEARAEYLEQMEYLATFCRQEADFIRAGGAADCYAGNKLQEALRSWLELPLAELRSKRKERQEKS